MITIKSKKEIELMREASRITSLVYTELEKYIKPGLSAKDLDDFADRIIKENGGVSAQKGYPSGEKDVPNFSGILCVSINDEVIHGVPHKTKMIQDGDLVSIDLVVRKNGYHGDAARTFKVGNVSKEANKLADVTKEAFFEGIKYAVAGNRIGDISNAIGQYVKKHGYSVIKEFQGHGIGSQMHEDPGIPNEGKPGRGPRLVPGMTLAVEPMVTEGKPDIYIDDDGWTVVTVDGSLAAHYENTILITEKEPEILTLVKD